jgi:hypothetical protein
VAGARGLAHQMRLRNPSLVLHRRLLWLVSTRPFYHTDLKLVK